MKKSGAVFIIFLLCASGIWVGNNAAVLLKSKDPVKQVLPAMTGNISPNPTRVSQKSAEPQPGIPLRLQIPAIGIDASIEQVGVDSEGRMGVPSTDDTVAWYSPGFKPGQEGNSVIDGHLDRISGAPAVFWNLAKLQAGDNIIVTDANGRHYSFSVTQSINYPYNEFPSDQIFGSSSHSNLNLITCQGTWDSINHNYSDRTVIYSQLQ